MALYDEIDEISRRNTVKTNTGDERIYGVAIGIVAEDYSDQMPGRICVIIPTRDTDANKLRWAKVVPGYGGNKWGQFFIPEKNDQVLLAFENGNIEKPFVIGSVHRDKDKLISECSNKDNQIKKIKTRNGSNITFFDSVPDDNGEKDKISVTTANDSHTFILDNENKKMEMYDKEKHCHVEMLTEEGVMKINAAKKLELKVGDNISIIMDGDKGKITIKANDIAVNCGNNINISASGNIKLEGQQLMENASSGMKLSAEMLTAAASVVKLG